MSLPICVPLAREDAPAGRRRRLARVLADHEAAAAVREAADHAVHVAVRAHEEERVLAAAALAARVLDQHVLELRLLARAADRVDVDAAQPVAFREVEELLGARPSAAGASAVARSSARAGGHRGTLAVTYLAHR